MSEGNETMQNHEWELFARLAQSFRESWLFSEDRIDDIEGSPLVVFCMGHEL